MKKQAKKVTQKEKELADYMEQKRQESMVGQKQSKKTAIQQALAGRMG